MPYPALPDHRMPYDVDGTLVYKGSLSLGATTALTATELQRLQDDDIKTAGEGGLPAISPGIETIFFFFPEQREITGHFAGVRAGGAQAFTGSSSFTGSNDTTNGLDGTWETASVPGGAPTAPNDFAWRSEIKPISFSGPKKNLRIQRGAAGDDFWVAAHLYGEAAGGAMAHDLIFLDPDLGAGVAFPAAEDFGDQPLGTTVVRPFRVKNTSASRTATNVNLQCNDTDFTIGESASGPWVVTINIASLGPGVESATLYTRCTTPAPGAALRPRFARIIAICDAGFFG